MTSVDETISHIGGPNMQFPITIIMDHTDEAMPGKLTVFLMCPDLEPIARPPPGTSTVNLQTCHRFNKTTQDQFSTHTNHTPTNIHMHTYICIHARLLSGGVDHKPNHRVYM